MMKVLVFLLGSASFICSAQPTSGPALSKPEALASHVTCDCTSYPFKPNPPCFGSCVGKLTSTRSPDLSAVKGLDPGVSVSIKVLAANPKKEAIDFSKMRGKFDLEQAADKSLRGNDLRFQPSRRQF